MDKADKVFIFIIRERPEEIEKGAKSVSKECEQGIQRKQPINTRKVVYFY